MCCWSLAAPFEGVDWSRTPGGLWTQREFSLFKKKEICQASNESFEMNPSPLWHLAVDFGQFDAFDVPPPIAPDQMACFLELQAETQYGEAGAFKMRQLLFFIRLC